MRYLSEPLEVQYEHIWQRPQAELDAALLELLAVGAAPGVVWGQLERTHTCAHTRAHTQTEREHQSGTTPSDHSAYKPALKLLSSSFWLSYASGESHALQTTMHAYCLFSQRSKHSTRSQITQYKPSGEREAFPSLGRSGGVNQQRRPKEDVAIKINSTLEENPGFIRSEWNHRRGSARVRVRMTTCAAPR